MSEKEKSITRVTAEEALDLNGRTDFSRLDAMTDQVIAKAVADDPDAAPTDLDWTKARLAVPPGKEVVTLRLDRDLLDWYKKDGRGYQTRINAVLRAFYDAKHTSNRP